MIDRRRLFLLALAWTIFAVYGSLVPLHYVPTDFATALERFRNLPPLWYGMGARADWVANILLFIPLTYLWTGFLSRKGKAGIRAVAAAVMVPVGCAAAVALEFTQIWFPGRTVSKNDIAAETIGSIVGVGLWLLFGEQFSDWAGSFAGDPRKRSRQRWILQAYLLGFAIYSVLPLDLTISIADLYHKYRNGQIVVVPYSYHYETWAAGAYDMISDVALFVPVGIWLVEIARERGRTESALTIGLVGGGVLAAAIEFAQLLVVSRYTDSTDIIHGTVGAVIGAAIAERLRATGRPAAQGRPKVGGRRVVIGILLAAYSLFLLAGFLYPFAITHDRSLIRTRLDLFLYRVPFVSLYEGTEFNATTQLLIRILLFAPIGCAWTVMAIGTTSKALRRLFMTAGICHAMILAAAIEVVQILMPLKIADTTEIALATFGAVLGSVVTRSLLESQDDTNARRIR